MTQSILHITAFAFRGGCEKNCYHFIKGSPELKHEIVVLGQPGPMTEDFISLGVPVRHLDIVRYNLIRFQRELSATLMGSKYDLVVLWSTIRLPMQLFALNDVTVQVRVYLGNPLSGEYESNKDSMLAFMFRARAMVKLMACSEYVAESHRKDGYFGKFPMEVSLNPVALPDSFPQKNYDSHHLNIGMVARLDPIKDHATAISGFSEFIEDFPTAMLHLVGDGSLRNDLEVKVKALGISSSVIFHGDVADVYHHLNQWNIFLYATTEKEGLGSAVAEAMANGLPCVLSDLPMLRELAPDEGLAYWFPKGAAAEVSAQLTRLSADESTRVELGNRAYHYAQEHFGTKRFVNDYLK